MRYIVIGAGAIGGTIGGRLAAGGHEAVLVARGAHLDALRAKGLTASGFLAPVTADVMRWKYGKLLANLSNATEAVCGTTPGCTRPTCAAG